MASVVSSLTEGLTPSQIIALNNQNHDTEIFTCAAVFSILTLLAVLMRVTSRHMKRVAVGIDDVMVMAALVRPYIPRTFKCTLLIRPRLNMFHSTDYYPGSNDLHLCR